MFTSGSGNLKETVFSIYGRELTKMLSGISYQDEQLSIDGFIGRPEAGRGNRNYEIIFVNGRFVRDKVISSAAEEAYRGSLMQHRFPFLILNIGLDTSKVDVNVHPSKMNLKFSDQEAVYDSVKKAVKEALAASRQVPSVEIELTGGMKEEPVPSVPKITEPLLSRKPDYAKKTNAALKKDAGSSEQLSLFDSPNKEKPHAEPFEKARREENTSAVKEQTEGFVKEQSSEKPTEPPKAFFEKMKRQIRIIGQLFDTYILAEEGEDFYIIDQHAAHEKVMYETFMKQIGKQEIWSQQLLPAKLISLSAAEADILEKRMELFADLGFEIEAFGGKEYRVTAVPYWFYGIDPEELFKEILDNELASGSKNDDAVRDRIVMKSCKAAVKANRNLSEQEIRKLIDDLFSLEDPYRCPHGRPAIVRMTRYEMDRKFKRIV